ncbi:PDZ domain-containing protein [Pyramidobacter sp.]|uniref:PDZ domain-containing protein n=2 Tax=Pyramidobacter sp. TaxID=1943581 RepID=UPI0039C3D5A4
MKFKNLLLSLIALVMLAAPGAAATTFITTVKDTNVDQVQEEAIKVFTQRKFSISEVTPYKIDFQKSSGDGFFLQARVMTVRINMLPKDGNVKLIVSEIELNNMLGARARSIDPIIPLIKTVRNAIDGTPMDSIVDESEDEKKPKVPESGLEFANARNSDGFPVISAVSKDSIAEKAGFKAGDIITEMNIRSTKDMNINELRTKINERIAGKRVVMLTFLREGKESTAKLKNPESANK